MKKFFGVAVMLALAACSESSTNPGDPSNPGPDPNSDGGGGKDGGKTDDPPAKDEKRGNVTLTQIVTAAGGSEFIQASASATFYEVTGGLPGSESSCKQSTDGDCSITECDIVAASDAGATDAGTSKSPHAGAITLTGASEMKLTPEADGSYKGASQQARLWAKDGSVAIKAAGGDVPAFEKSLDGPAAVTVTAPAWPASPATPIEIDRANDLEIKWSNGGTGNVQAMVGSSTSAKMASISCTFKSDTGAGKISKSALAKLFPEGNASISVYAASGENVEAGDWKVSLVALTPASTSGGGNATGLAKIK